MWVPNETVVRAAANKTNADPGCIFQAIFFVGMLFLMGYITDCARALLN